MLNIQHSNPRNEITSTEKTADMAGSSSILAPSKLAQSQPHSTNRDSTSFSIDNRLYLDGLRHHPLHQQRQGSFSSGSLTISPAGGTSNCSSRDSNNNNGLSTQSNIFASQTKLLNRLDIDTIRSNINRNVSNCSASTSMMHHQHGTILFNTLNGGALGASGNSLMAGSSADCFSGPDIVDSTTPPPSTAISMPPSASSASSSSSTISTNIGLTRNSNGSSQDGSQEKIKTPNSIRGRSWCFAKCFIGNVAK